MTYNDENNTSSNDTEHDLEVSCLEGVILEEELWSNNTINAIIDPNGSVNIINESTEDPIPKTPEKNKENQYNYTSPFKDSLYFPEKAMKKRKAVNSPDKQKKREKLLL